MQQRALVLRARVLQCPLAHSRAYLEDPGAQIKGSSKRSRRTCWGVGFRAVGLVYYTEDGLIVSNTSMCVLGLFRLGFTV